MNNIEKRFIEIENQSSGECEELEYGDEYIEAKVVSLTRKIHPQDLGEKTSKLENTLRQALEEIVVEDRKRVRENLPKVITPTVEPPPNNLSQNQIFAGGQMNMLLRVTDLLASFELQTSLDTNKE